MESSIAYAAHTETAILDSITVRTAMLNRIDVNGFYISYLCFTNDGCKKVSWLSVGH